MKSIADDSHMNGGQKTGLPVADVVVTVLPASGHKLKLEADKDECRAIAGFLDIAAVNFLRADLKFSRWHRDGVRVSGQIRARLEQHCVVTLEPVQTLIDESFEALFVPEGSRLARPKTGPDGELVLDPEGADMPDPFVGERLDAWAIVLEHLQLFVDPFVRKEGAEFATHLHEEAESGAASAKTSPFAVLKSLKTPKRD